MSSNNFGEEYQMKKILRRLLLDMISLIGMILSLLTSINLISSSSRSLNTRKIDKNIEKLRELEWFNELYKIERHRKSFFINMKVRKYLQSNILVARLKNNKNEQKKFIKLVEDVAKLRNKNLK